MKTEQLNKTAYVHVRYNLILTFDGSKVEQVHGLACKVNMNEILITSYQQYVAL